MNSRNIEIELIRADQLEFASEASVRVRYAPRIPIPLLNMSWQSGSFLGWRTYQPTIKWKTYPLREIALSQASGRVVIAIPRKVPGAGPYVADWIVINISGGSNSLHPDKKNSKNSGNDYVVSYPLIIRLRSDDLRFKEFPDRDEYYLDQQDRLHVNPACLPAYQEKQLAAWRLAEEEPGKSIPPPSGLQLVRLDGRTIHQLTVHRVLPDGWQLIKVLTSGPEKTRQYDLFYLYENGVMRSLRVDDYYESGGRRTYVYDFKDGKLIYSQAPTIWSVLYEEQGITPPGVTRPDEQTIQAIQKDFEVLAKYLTTGPK